MDDSCHPLGACLVIGASGMVGRRLSAELRRHAVSHGISKLVLCDLHAPPSVAECDAFVPLDITDTAATLNVVSDVNPETVFLVFGSVDFRPEARDKIEAVHVGGMRSVLEGIRTAGTVKRLVYLSSVAAVTSDRGESTSLLRPNPPADLQRTIADAAKQRLLVSSWPRSSYGSSKALAEALLYDYASSSALAAVVIRSPVVLYRELLSAEPEPTFGDLECCQSFVTVTTLVEALVAAASRAHANRGRAFYVKDIDANFFVLMHSLGQSALGSHLSLNLVFFVARLVDCIFTWLFFTGLVRRTAEQSVRGPWFGAFALLICVGQQTIDDTDARERLGVNGRPSAQQLRDACT